MAAFLTIEARSASNPIVPLRIFRRRHLSAANAIASAVGATVVGTYYFVSLYLQQVLGDTPLEAGLAFLPIGLLTFAGALVAARVVGASESDVSSYSPPCSGMAGPVWLSRVTADSTHEASVLRPLALLGAGIGLTFIPMTLAATTGVLGHQGAWHQASSTTP